MAPYESVVNEIDRSISWSKYPSELLNCTNEEEVDEDKNNSAVSVTNKAKQPH